jgi:hypothetical protein
LRDHCRDGPGLSLYRTPAPTQSAYDRPTATPALPSCSRTHPTVLPPPPRGEPKEVVNRTSCSVNSGFNQVSVYLSVPLCAGERPISEPFYAVKSLFSARERAFVATVVLGTTWRVGIGSSCKVRRCSKSRSPQYPISPWILCCSHNGRLVHVVFIGSPQQHG